MSDAPAAGATDFSARLQAALGQAKGQTARSATIAPAPDATEPPSDEYNDRLTSALSQARGEPEAVEQESPVEVSEGPVGQGDCIVSDGDCIASIAKDKGHFWRTIWDDPANAELREIRLDPNVLLPGDRVTIMERRRKDETIAAEQRHRFKRLGEPHAMRMRVLRNDVPRANEPFTLDIDGQPGPSGTTDPEGRINTMIPGNAKRVHLVVGPVDDQVAYLLELGKADPISSLRGVQQRLCNLGLLEGPHDGISESATAAAIGAFQSANGLPVTGEADQQTRARLREVHES